MKDLILKNNVLKKNKLKLVLLKLKIKYNWCFNNVYVRKKKIILNKEWYLNYRRDFKKESEKYNDVYA